MGKQNVQAKEVYEVFEISIEDYDKCFYCVVFFSV